MKTTYPTEPMPFEEWYEWILNEAKKVRTYEDKSLNYRNLNNKKDGN